MSVTGAYEVLEREVRANHGVPGLHRGRRRQDAGCQDDGALGCSRSGHEVIKQVHERLVQIARDKGVTAGRRMRVDTTVVETDIHHPTDSTLMGDGVRVLTRMDAQDHADCGCGWDEAARSQQKCELGCWRSGRWRAPKAPINQEKLKQRYARLIGHDELGVVGQGEALRPMRSRRRVKRSKEILNAACAGWPAPGA